MAGQLNVYGMASQGVNVDLNDVNMEDGMLRKAQNAIHDPTGAMGSVRKRPGLAKLNSSAVSGSVFGITNVPIAPVSVRRFLVGINQAVESDYQWVTSVDEFGNTTTSTTPAAVSSTTRNGGGADADFYGTAVQSESLFIYPGQHTVGTEDPVLRVWDGITDRELLRVPQNPFAGQRSRWTHDMLLDDTRLYFIVHDSVTQDAYTSRVMLFDLESNTLTQIGESFGDDTGEIGDTTCGIQAQCLALHQGFLYCGVTEPSLSAGSDTDAGIYRIRVGMESTWTRDFSMESSSEAATCMVSYKGLLYVGLRDLLSQVGRLLVRDATGSYSSSTDSGGTPGGALSGWTAMVVFGDNLYACRFHNAGGASNQTSISKFDGSSWSSVKTIDTSATPRKGFASVVHNGRLYILAHNQGNGLVTHTADGSSWTDISTNLTTAVTSFFGILTD